MNALNGFVQNFAPQEEQQQPQSVSKGTLDKNWQRLKQGITNSVSQAIPQGGNQQ